MANIYDWKINQLDAKIHEDNLDNVIFAIHWTYIASDDSEPRICVEDIGVCPIIYNPENPFIPYTNLTKDEVVGWLESNLDVDKMKINLDKQIELKKNPVDEFLKPPWDPPIPPPA